MTGWGTRSAMAGLLAALCGCTTPEGETITFFSLIPNQSELRGPANLPPDDYAGEYWVDRRGCIFIRTGQGPSVRWVPQVNFQREPICDPERAGQVVVPNPDAAPQVDQTPRVEIDPETGLRVEVLPPRVIPRSYVFVRSFEDRAAGLAAREQFAGMGFPIVGGDATPPEGAPMAIVLGPFEVQSALDDALNVATGLGYAEAYSYRN